MIVPMKKVVVIVQPKDASCAAGRLQALGVLHVEHQKTPKAKDVSLLHEDIASVDKAIGIISLKEFSKNIESRPGKDLKDWRFTARHIIDLENRLQQLEDFSRNLSIKIQEWQAWGDFDPRKIRELAEKNIHIRLYQIPVQEMKNLPDAVIVKRQFSARGLVHCALISEGKAGVPFKEVELPKAGLERMRSRLAEDSRMIEVIKSDIRRQACYIESFKKLRLSLVKDLEFQEALAGMGEARELAYLAGYIPYDAEGLLLKTAKKEEWGIIVKDPSDDDRVPTLIRNPRWVSIIEPIFKVIEVVPGYREADISLWFLVFLSVFFGMLIGDAGYGVIFFLLTFFAQRRWQEKLGNNSVFILFYLFSSCAIIWGFLTATFFGQGWLSSSVKPLMPALRSSRNLQELCFFIGALHLSIGHLWRFARKVPSLLALADAGWILILWGAFFLAKALILGDEFAPFAKWFFVIGPLLVVFFTAFKKNLLKAIGAGFGNLLLNLVNSFTDVVSYIRLFAVGLATVAVADAFNRMALDVGYNGIVTGLVTTFILLLGHSLNIVLGPMAVLVHGVRLNVLEFCNHIDVKWSGFDYRPLKQ